jgi:hypothetical protein
MEILKAVKAQGNQTKKLLTLDEFKTIVERTTSQKVA